MPAQQIDPFFPWLMQETGAKTFYMPSADYIWPHTLNKKVREVVADRGGEIVGEEYFPLDHMDYDGSSPTSWRRGRTSCSTPSSRRGSHLPRAAARAGFTARGGTIVCTYFDENFLNLVPAEQVEGLYGCLDYYRDVDDPFSIELLNRYEARTPGAPCSRRAAPAPAPTGR